IPRWSSPDPASLISRPPLASLWPSTTRGMPRTTISFGPTRRWTASSGSADSSKSDGCETGSACWTSEPGPADFPSSYRRRIGSWPPIPAIVHALEAAGFRAPIVDDRAYVRRLATEEQLGRVRHRYLSTFDLLPPGEYERGLRFLETEMPRRYGDRFEISARFTFVGATR